MERQVSQEVIKLHQSKAPCKTCSHSEITSSGYLRCTIFAMLSCGGTETYPYYKPKEEK